MPPGSRPYRAANAGPTPPGEGCRAAQGLLLDDTGRDAVGATVPGARGPTETRASERLEYAAVRLLGESHAAVSGIFSPGADGDAAGGFFSLGASRLLGLHLFKALPVAPDLGAEVGQLVVLIRFRTRRAWRRRLCRLRVGEEDAHHLPAGDHGSAHPMRALDDVGSPAILVQVRVLGLPHLDLPESQVVGAVEAVQGDDFRRPVVAQRQPAGGGVGLLHGVALRLQLADTRLKGFDGVVVVGEKGAGELAGGPAGRLGVVRGQVHGLDPGAHVPVDALPVAPSAPLAVVAYEDGLSHRDAVGDGLGSMDPISAAGPSFVGPLLASV